LNREDILAVCNAGPEAVIALILKLQEEILELKERIKALEDRLGQNSSNSSKPPSSDWSKKQRSLRTKSGKSPGGQKGHKGHNLKMVTVPDATIVHGISACCKCGGSLDNTEPAGYR